MNLKGSLRTKLQISESMRSYINYSKATPTYHKTMIMHWLTGGVYKAKNSKRPAAGYELEN